MGESQQEPDVQPPQEPQAGQPAGALTQQEERTWGMLAHLLALAGYIVPFGHIVGPLVIWLIQKDKSAFVDQNGKESLNFQISMTIYLAVAIPLGILLVVICIGPLIPIALAVFDIVVVIMAAVKANGGESYRYPLCIRFIK